MENSEVKSDQFVISPEQFLIAISMYAGYKFGYKGCFPWKARYVNGSEVREHITVHAYNKAIDPPIAFPSAPIKKSFDGKEITLSGEEILHALSMYCSSKRHRSYEGNMVKQSTLNIPSEIKFTLSFAVEFVV